MDLTHVFLGLILCIEDTLGKFTWVFCLISPPLRKQTPRVVYHMSISYQSNVRQKAVHTGPNQRYRGLGPNTRYPTSELQSDDCIYKHAFAKEDKLLQYRIIYFQTSFDGNDLRNHHRYFFLDQHITTDISSFLPIRLPWSIREEFHIRVQYAAYCTAAK